MEEYGFFWNSKNGDRRYSADSFEKWLKKFFTTGVFEGDLQVTSAGGMDVSVATGYCNVNGKVMLFEPKEFTLEPAYPSNDRIDAVVIERNDNDRAITMKVVKGGTDGAAPLPERDADTYQLIIAYISVAAGAVSISQMDITDKRMDSTVCGYVAGAVDQIDWDQAYAQLSDWLDHKEDEILSWFEHIRDQLDDDAAAHLQNEVDDLDTGKENRETWATVTLAASGWTEDTDGTFVYSLETAYPSTDYDITDVLPVSTTTEAMRNAWIIADCGGREDTNIIRCHGVVPTIDIVIGMCVRPKGLILY